MVVPEFMMGHFCRGNWLQPNETRSGEPRRRSSSSTERACSSPRGAARDRAMNGRRSSMASKFRWETPKPRSEPGTATSAVCRRIARQTVNRLTED